MPQSSYTYASARLSALSKRLLDAQTIRRMTDGSVADAMRALLDTRYGGLADATESDVERMIDNELVEAMQEVRDLSPDPQLTDLFLLRADVQNLQTLIKARLSHQDDPLWTAGGLFDRDPLTIMVRDQKYKTLPESFQTALRGLERQLQIRVEPQQISIALDRAYLKHALLASKADPVLSQYFRALADFDNVLTFLRLRAMGASISELDEVLLPEGGITHKTLMDSFELSFDLLNRVLHASVCRDALLSGLNAMQRTGNISEVEKARDNYLLSLISVHKYETNTLYPIIGYYLAKEREGKAVRLVITAKRNDLPESVIRERLVTLYGER